MMKRKMVPGVLSALGMLVLILDSQTALQGAREGVELCVRTVIPSLFPFFVLSGILVSRLMGFSMPFLRPVGWLLGMPQGTESLLVSSFLGGYPVGAKAVQDAWANGYLTKEDAQRLLSFCNNAGPAFLFGMAGPLFSSRYAGWALWGIHILSALLTGLLFRSEPLTHGAMPEEEPASLPDALQNALRVTAQVCGWVVLFRILCAFLNRWFLWLLPGWAGVAVTGLLELTNGCVQLAVLESETVRFLLCSGMLSFGGLCVLLQTVSVTRGLSLKFYFTGKLLQTLLSLLLSMLYLRMLSPLWIFTLFPLILIKKSRKKGGIPGAVGV